MNQINKALEKIKNMKFEIGEKTKYILFSPIEYYLRHLSDFGYSDKTIERIKNAKTYSEIGVLKKPIDIEEFCQKLIENLKNHMELIGTFPNLTLKDIRYLILYDKLYITETLVDIRNYFFRYLLEIDRITSLTLSRITIMYFKHYFLLKDDQVFLIFYKALCEKYQKQGKIFPKGLQNIVELCSLFDGNLPYEIADNCVYIKENTNLLIKNIMNEKFSIIHYDTDLYNEIIKNIGIICYENIKNDFYFDILISEILKLPIPKEQMDEIVSRIIELYSDENEINLNIKNKLKFELLNNENYGDPRLKEFNWAGVNKKSLKIFISWLAKDDLEFFFKLMFIENVDTQARQKFWKQYINSEDLLYSKIILSNETAKSSKAKEAEKEGRVFAKFSSFVENTSCFILAFRNVYIVEFSEKNNALYLYNKNYIDQNQNKINLNMNKLKYDSVSNFKLRKAKILTDPSDSDLDEVKYVKIVHCKNWQRLVKDYLSKLAIYPGRN